MAQRKASTDSQAKEWLTRAMEHHGDSQSSLSRRSKVGQTTIGRILRGEVNPGIATLRQLADALDAALPFDGGSAGEPAPRQRGSRPGMLHIPRLDVSGSMGPGIAQPEDDVAVDSISVSPGWLRQQGHFSSAANLAIINAIGTSMQPTFADGDLLIVDRSVTDLRLDAVYVLAIDGDLFIKRVQRQFDGGLLILSDNPTHPPQSIPAHAREQLSVLGRVIVALNTRRL
jgi:transcriptional regulator with XRE-family HTH domain